MPKVLLYSDPHIGLTRRAHYTEASSRAREAFVVSELTQLLQDSINAGHAFRICAGDFFDKESVSEQTILDSLPIAERTDFIMAGNHDLSNRDGKATSFSILAEIVGQKALIADYKDNIGFSAEIGSTLFCFAPHVLTQAAYEAMIEDLRLEAAKFAGYRVLIAHCNYNMNQALLSESTLNLSQELAYNLLADFHYIAIGHQHTPMDLCEGRIKIIGSYQPTAFDNMESKRALVFDTETGLFEDLQTWGAEQHYYSGLASDTPTDFRQYCDLLLDDMNPGEAQKLATDLFRAGAFGVRLRRPEEEEKGERKEVSVAAFHRLPETISQELQESRPHLVPLWEEVSHA
jgi:DNA repair exonuclease SbcCD nuclease subunit